MASGTSTADILSPTAHPDMVARAGGGLNPVSITVNSDSSSQSNEPIADQDFVQHSKEEANNKLVIDISKNFPDKEKPAPSRAVLKRIDSDEDTEDTEDDLARTNHKTYIACPRHSLRTSSACAKDNT